MDRATHRGRGVTGSERNVSLTLPIDRPTQECYNGKCSGGNRHADVSEDFYFNATSRIIRRQRAAIVLGAHLTNEGAVPPEQPRDDGGPLSFIGGVMPLEMLDLHGKFRPSVVCDVCQERITNIEEGVVWWLGLEDRRPVCFTHKGKCAWAIAKDPGLCDESLNAFLAQLLYWLRFDPNRWPGLLRHGRNEPQNGHGHGFVYLMRANDGRFQGLYKIGQTSDLKQRLGQIRAAHGDVVLLHSIEVPDKLMAEINFHDVFADKRKHLEWFALDDADIARWQDLATYWTNLWGMWQKVYLQSAETLGGGAVSFLDSGDES